MSGDNEVVDILNDERIDPELRARIGWFVQAVQNAAFFSGVKLDLLASPLAGIAGAFAAQSPAERKQSTAETALLSFNMNLQSNDMDARAAAQGHEAPKERQ